jgi:hypothetical protein
MRLTKDLQCLKVKSDGHAAKAIDDIGRLVGYPIRLSLRDRIDLARPPLAAAAPTIPPRRGADNRFSVCAHRPNGILLWAGAI